MGSCWIDPTVVNSYPTSKPAIPPPQPGQIAPIAEFPAKKWGADFESFIGLADFGHTNWKSIQLRPPPPAESPIVQYEITYLVQASLQRAARLPEILAQDQNFQQYLVGLLMISPRSFPKTYLTLKIAARVGEMLMAYFKMYYSRPRPVQLYPALFPPCDTADHASYPSGHSLISHLIAFAGAEVVPYMRGALVALADRISENREIAGFHYPSDTIAAKELASQAYTLLRTSDYFRDLLPQATAEWPPVPVPPVLPEPSPTARATAVPRAREVNITSRTLIQ